VVPQEVASGAWVFAIACALNAPFATACALNALGGVGGSQRIASQYSFHGFHCVSWISLRFMDFTAFQIVCVW
jgi:hypothetical protein